MHYAILQSLVKCLSEDASKPPITTVVLVFRTLCDWGWKYAYMSAVWSGVLEGFSWCRWVYNQMELGDEFDLRDFNVFRIEKSMWIAVYAMHLPELDLILTEFQASLP